MPLSSICGVTSSAMPLKKGVSVTVGVLVVLPAVLPTLLVDPPVTPVTKYSSTPTLSTAFWLFSVATRGLDRICTSPCVSRKPSTAWKPLVASVRPSDALPAAGRPTVSSNSEASPVGIVGRPLALLISALLLTPLVWPTAPWLRSSDQSMPLWKPSRSSTSTILASSITWRSTATRDARRNWSTWRSSSGMARTAMVPACGLVMTRRPSPLPSRPRSASAVSVQKSLLEVVVIWLLSGAFCEAAAAPLLPPPLLPLLALWKGAELLVTRTSERPLRSEVM